MRIRFTFFAVGYSFLLDYDTSKNRKIDRNWNFWWEIEIKKWDIAALYCALNLFFLLLTSFELFILYSLTCNKYYMYTVYRPYNVYKTNIREMYTYEMHVQLECSTCVQYILYNMYNWYRDAVIFIRKVLWYAFNLPSGILWNGLCALSTGHNLWFRTMSVISELGGKVTYSVSLGTLRAFIQDMRN